MSLGPTGLRAVLTAYGTDPLDAIEHHLRLEPQLPPDPDQLGPRDVVVKVQAAAVGWVDLIMCSGQYQHMATPPYTPGLEWAGEVVWTGDDVQHLTVGAQVMADGFRTGPRSHGPHQRWGGFASYAVAPAEALLPLPEGWTPDQGCNLLGSYETAYHCLVHRGRLQPGETVLIHGATGATGLAAVHLAKILGATVIATSRSEDKLAIVREEGADHTICTADGLGGLRDAVRGLTEQRGVHVVYDGVGGPVTEASLRCMRFGGRLLIVGWAATPDVSRGRGQRGAPRANRLPTNLVMMKGLDVLGCPTIISTKMDPSIRKQRLAAVLGWVASGELRPRTGPSFPLSDLREAMRAKWESRFVPGCTVHPG